MLTWTAPNRVLAAYADVLPPVAVRVAQGKTQPVWSVAVLAVSARKNPQHQLVATFTGKNAEREARTYADAGLAARIAKLKAQAKA
jgi:hypothetical protein